MNMLNKADSYIVELLKKTTITVERISPIVVIGFAIYCLINKVPLTYEGLNLFFTNCDLTQLIIVSLVLLLPTISFLSGENTIGFVLVISSLFYYFNMLGETDKFTILVYGLANPLAKTLDTIFWSTSWLYDKYCKDTEWDRFVSKY